MAGEADSQETIIVAAEEVETLIEVPETIESDQVLALAGQVIGFVHLAATIILPTGKNATDVEHRNRPAEAQTVVAVDLTTTVEGTKTTLEEATVAVEILITETMISEIEGEIGIGTGIERETEIEKEIAIATVIGIEIETVIETEVVDIVAVHRETI